MKEILNNIVTTAVSVWHTFKRLVPVLNVLFEVFLLVALVVSVVTKNFQFAIYYIGLEVLVVLFEIRKNSKNKPEVDLRMGSELVAGIIAGFLKENPDFKLVKRTSTESQADDETRA